MNVTKNKQSTLLNLAEIISGCDSEKLTRLEKFITSQKKKPKTLQLVKRLEGDSPIVDMDREGEASFKKNLGKELEHDGINKLIENTYNKILEFLAIDFANSDKGRVLQSYRDSLDTIDSLIELKLFDIAAAELYKLENRLKDDEHKDNWIKDDLSLKPKMAQLKIFLSYRTEQILDKTYLDELLSRLFQAGENMYNDKFETYPHYFNSHRMIGYNLLYDYAKEKNQMEIQLQMIDNQGMELARNMKVGFQRAVLNDSLTMNKILTLFRMGEWDKIDRLLAEDPEVGKTGCNLAFNQFLFDLLTKIGVARNKEPTSSPTLHFANLGLYDISTIERFALRRELNEAIILLRGARYNKCLAIIEELKKVKDVKNKGSRLYQDLLFIEVMTHFLAGGEHADKAIRKLTELLKVNGKSQGFEFNALKLFNKYKTHSHPPFDRSFEEKFESEIKELETKSLNGDPIHALTLAMLKGHFPRKGST